MAEAAAAVDNTATTTTQATDKGAATSATAAVRRAAIIGGTAPVVLLLEGDARLRLDCRGRDVSPRHDPGQGYRGRMGSGRARRVARCSVDGTPLG